jgi:hypothetical protein
MSRLDTFTRFKFYEEFPRCQALCSSCAGCAAGIFCRGEIYIDVRYLLPHFHPRRRFLAVGIAVIWSLIATYKFARVAS